MHRIAFFQQGEPADFARRSRFSAREPRTGLLAAGRAAAVSCLLRVCLARIRRPSRNPQGRPDLYGQGFPLPRQTDRYSLQLLQQRYDGDDHHGERKPRAGAPLRESRSSIAATRTTPSSCSPLNPNPGKGQGMLRVDKNMWRYDPTSRKFTHTTLKDQYEDTAARNSDFRRMQRAMDYSVLKRCRVASWGSTMSG